MFHYVTYVWSNWGNSFCGQDHVLTTEFGLLVFGYFTLNLYLSLAALRVSHPSWGQDTGRVPPIVKGIGYLKAELNMPNAVNLYLWSSQVWAHVHDTDSDTSSHIWHMQSGIQNLSTSYQDYKLRPISLLIRHGWLMRYTHTEGCKSIMNEIWNPYMQNELKRFQVIWHLKLIYAHMNWFAIGREYGSVISWVSIKAAPRAAVIPTITT